MFRKLSKIIGLLLFSQIDVEWRNSLLLWGFVEPDGKMDL